MSRPIEVFNQPDGQTRIVVRNWPDSRAPWRVSSADQRGRELEIDGWSNFQQTVVAHLSLHVDSRKPLLITAYRFDDGLLDSERPEVLAHLILCARAVATRLHEDLGVGDGCLMWQLESRLLAQISRRFPQFEAVPKRRHLLPGKRYLVWRP